MFIEFVSEKSKSFPKVDEPDRVSALRIWNCKFESLWSISEFRNLCELQILGFPDDTLEAVGQLQRLESLSICHMPKIRKLTPLQRLSKLTSLSLQTLPSWDSSGKVQVIDALEPLAGIESLKFLELFGVRPPDQSLAPLEKCSNLRSLRCSKYPKQEVARFLAATGCTDDFCPQETLAS